MTVVDTNITDANIAANAAAASVNVSGTVTRSNGTPVSGVSLSLKLGGVTKKIAATDTNGTYTFTNVADGTYTVAASKSGYTFPTPVPSVTVSGSSQSVVTISSITP